MNASVSAANILVSTHSCFWVNLNMKKIGIKSIAMNPGKVFQVANMGGGVNTGMYFERT